LNTLELRRINCQIIFKKNVVKLYDNNREFDQHCSTANTIADARADKRHSHSITPDFILFPVREAIHFRSANISSPAICIETRNTLAWRTNVAWWTRLSVAPMTTMTWLSCFQSRTGVRAGINYFADYPDQSWPEG